MHCPATSATISKPTHIHIFVQPRPTNCPLLHYLISLFTVNLSLHDLPGLFVRPETELLIGPQERCSPMKCDGIDLQGSIHSDTVKGVSSGSTTFEFDRPGLIDPRFFPDKVYVNPPGGDQAQPACFGAGQVLIPERSEHDRLCSTCMSLGRLNSTHWEDINNFREVTVNHPHSIDALITSAREGCHLCGLLLTALEEEIRLSQEPRGGWIFEAGTNSGALTGIIRLRFQRDEPTLPWDGFVFDGVRIVLLCGGLPGGEGGRLICQAMDSERSSFLTSPVLHD